MISCGRVGGCVLPPWLSPWPYMEEQLHRHPRDTIDLLLFPCSILLSPLHLPLLCPLFVPPPLPSLFLIFYLPYRAAVAVKTTALAASSACCTLCDEVHAGWRGCCSSAPAESGSRPRSSARDPPHCRAPFLLPFTSGIPLSLPPSGHL